MNTIFFVIHRFKKDKKIHFIKKYSKYEKGDIEKQIRIFNNDSKNIYIAELVEDNLCLEILYKIYPEIEKKEQETILNLKRRISNLENTIFDVINSLQDEYSKIV